MIKKKQKNNNKINLAWSTIQPSNHPTIYLWTQPSASLHLLVEQDHHRPPELLMAPGSIGTATSRPVIGEGKQRERYLSISHEWKTAWKYQQVGTNNEATH